jgi:signal peptidase
VVACVVLAVAVLVLAVTVLVPRLAGATPYTVLTSSMEPGMPPGTLVVTRPVDVDDIDVGSVITYQLESGRPTVVTHRVTAIGYDLEGRRLLTTQGDANTVPDATPVRAVQIRGEQWYAVPHLGRLSTVLSGSERQLGVVIVAMALLAYAVRMFAGAVRGGDRRRGAHARLETSHG